VHDNDTALAVALNFHLSSFEQVLVASVFGSVVVPIPDEEWTLGPGPVVTTLIGGPAGGRGGTFALFRRYPLGDILPMKH
jgi:hypothetical protein